MTDRGERPGVGETTSGWGIWEETIFEVNVGK